MIRNGRLFLVQAVHTVIYVVMASAILLVLFAGLTGASGPWLWICVALVLVEAAVFIGSGMRCPLTNLAARYGAGRPGLSDTFFPERFTRHTLRVFEPLLGLDLGLLLLRWLLLGR